MERKELLKGLLAMLKDLKESAEGHIFDVNSDKCKSCSSFAICKGFNGILESLTASKYDDKVKDDLVAFIAFIKYEYLWLEDFDVDKNLKDEEFTVYEIYKRFDNLVDNFKNWDKLIELLDNNQLSLIRKIILDVNQKIIDLLERVKDDNLKEMNKIITRLHKSEDIGGPRDNKKIPYEEMTREELIEELKKK